MTTDLQQAPKLPPFNSTLSMKAMCVAQATEALRAELKLTPAECIAIEMEMATRIHRKPALAHAKFAEMAADIAVIMPWFETFLELLRTSSDRQRRSGRRGVPNQQRRSSGDDD
jgi:hypothetical protein